MATDDCPANSSLGGLEPAPRDEPESPPKEKALEIDSGFMLGQFRHQSSMIFQHRFWDGMFYGFVFSIVTTCFA